MDRLPPPGCSGATASTAGVGVAGRNRRGHPSPLSAAVVGAGERSLRRRRGAVGGRVPPVLQATRVAAPNLPATDGQWWAVALLGRDLRPRRREPPAGGDRWGHPFVVGG